MEFLTGSENSASVVLSCADLGPTVVVCIVQLTMCHICISLFHVLAAATVVKLSTEHMVVGVILAGSEAGAV